jgi:hypothetical protein
MQKKNFTAGKVKTVGCIESINWFTTVKKRKPFLLLTSVILVAEAPYPFGRCQ